jgi:transcriptional regulator GlxA family with amidase domain
MSLDRWRCSAAQPAGCRIRGCAAIWPTESRLWRSVLERSPRPQVCASWRSARIARSRARTPCWWQGAAATPSRARRSLSSPGCVRMANCVTRLGSVCNGALILAAAGLLEGRRATTHWAYLEELKKSVGHGLCHDAIYARDGNVYTSAGVTAGMDMGLAMLEEDHGGTVALAVARELVLFLKRPGGQSQFSDYLAAQFSEDAGLRELQIWMLEHLNQDLSVPRLAERLAMSERSFARHFVDGIGVAPGHYVKQIRVTAARRKLEQTDLPLCQIARRCGFGAPETLRRSFVTALGVTPGAYRERFRAK